MLKWFSISGISKEVKRTRWPKPGNLANSSGEVLLFCLFFGLFFVGSEFLVTLFLKLIGIGA